MAKEEYSYDVQLTYFKASGKYYSGEEYETCKESLLDIWEEVKTMETHPGLNGKWSEGFILVNVPNHPHDHPKLIIV